MHTFGYTPLAVVSRARKTTLNVCVLILCDLPA
jgi:hypothetical protein